MSKKKLVSLALACVLAFTLAVPALATSSNRQTVVTALYKDVTINVTVPATQDATINPYALPLVVRERDATYGEVKVIGEQIVSLPMALRNNGDVSLNVHVKLSAAVHGNLKLSSTAPTDKTNTAYAYFQIKSDNATSGPLEDLKGLAVDDADEIDYQIAAALADEDVWTGVDKHALTARGADVKDAAILYAVAHEADPDATPGSAEAQIEYANGSIAVMRIAGNVVAEPDTPWTPGNKQSDGSVTGDGFTATLVFTFTPHVATP